jgi:hypothetical protein
MTEKDFIEKVNKQRGYIGVLDAWRLIHFFTEKWGVIYTELPIENELIYMWLKLQEEKKKYCKKCDTYKDMNDFHNNIKGTNGKCAYCKDCSSEYRKKRRLEYGVND